MSRARNIKPSFFRNPDLAEIKPLTRLLFIGLWTMADREGRLEDRPRYIKFELLPSDEFDVDDALETLRERGFILRYDCDGERFIQIINFAKHQHPHIKETASTIPAPGEHRANTVQARASHDASTSDARASHDASPNKARASTPELTTELTTDTARYARNARRARESAQNDAAAQHAPTTIEQRFDQFWSAYPVKRNKQAALKVWRRIKPDDALTATIIASIEQHQRLPDWTKENGRFIPYPSSWLNAGGWQDELDDAASSATQMLDGRPIPKGYKIGADGGLVSIDLKVAL